MQSVTGNYERASHDVLLLIFTLQLGIMLVKHVRVHIGNLRRQIYTCYKGYYLSI